MISPSFDRKFTKDGIDFCYCSREQVYKPCDEFGRSSKANTGYQYICKICSTKATSTKRSDDHYENVNDLKIAHELLEKIGYNPKSDIPLHKQFEMKYNLTDDTI